MEPIDVNNVEDTVSSTNPQSPSITSTTDCEPLSPDYSPIHSSEEEEDVYIHEEDEEAQKYDTDPRLDIIDKQFNLKVKELLSRLSNDQLVPYIEASLQHTAEEMLKRLSKSHPLTWVFHEKSSPEENELKLWMTVMQDNVDVLVTQFQQKMYTGFSKMMSEMVQLYYK